jgi:hypothetical protein
VAINLGDANDIHSQLGAHAQHGRSASMKKG